MWYTQPDGEAMGAPLAVIFANLWIISLEKSLQKPNEGRENKAPDTKVLCIVCKRPVTFRGKGFECKSCKYWFYAKFQGITETEYKDTEKTVCICSF